MSHAITARQTEILKFISNFILDHRHAPTRREIMSHFGLKSTTGVNHHLIALKKKGYLLQTGRGARALEIPGYSITIGIPIITKVAAGKPILSRENLKEVLALDRKAAPWNDSYFVRIEDSSMMRAGIFVGDHALIEPLPSIKEGELAAALLGDELIIRYFEVKKDFIFLYLDKTDNNPIPLARNREDFRFLGKVVAIIRFLAGPMTAVG